ncbi:MAG: hypothetical protein IJY90_01135 [Clostridia bacterium]|nr:hypothetical protein [Clostridia bacterium]
MLKKHSKIKFFILTIIAILGVLLSVCSFSVPNSQTNFPGFLSLINKGIELNGGVEAVYTCTLKEGVKTDLDDAVEDAAGKVEELYTKLSANIGYNELHVNKLGNNKIQVLFSDDASVADPIYEYTKTSKELYMTLTESADANRYVFPNDVASVVIGRDATDSSLGINVNFTSLGQSHIQDLKSHADDDATVYIYMGSELFTSVSVDEVKNGMFITSDSVTEDTIIETCHNIIAGSMEVSFTDVSVHELSPALGINVKLYILIALAVIICMAFAFMYVRYGHLGLIAMLSMTFYLVLFVFFMQAIPFIVMNLVGVIAGVAAFLIATAANCYIFEKIRDEYAIGKKIHISCKSAFKSALWPIIDSHVALALASICIWIFAPASVKLVGVALLVGAVLSVFTSLAMTRYFVNLYLPLNSTKPQKLRLYRDKNVKEIKQDEVEIISPDQTIAQNGEGENE